MKRVAIYVRVSTEQQAKEGDSVPAQLEALHKYVQDNNDMILAGEYVDGGVSGTKYEERDELQRLLEDVQDGKIDLLLFTKLDRWFRSVRHYTQTQEILDQHKVGWKAIWEPIYDTTTPAGRLIVNQMMSIAQFEAENTGLRIKQVFDYKIKNSEVISGKQPVGYSIRNKHLVPNKDAEIIRGLFRHYDETNSLTSSTLYLREHGIVRAKFMTKEMLKNTKYIGLYKGNENYCPPIIDRDLFETVQRKLQTNIKKDQKHTYLFSGLVRCNECGRKMQAYQTIAKSGRKTYHYPKYRCVSHYLPTELYSCDNTKTITESVLERYLLEHVRSEAETLLINVEAEQAKVVDNSAKITAQTMRLNKLKELFLNDLISLDEYREGREEVMKKIDDLKEQKKTDTSDLSELKDLLSSPFESMYERLTLEEKRYLWRSVIKEIQFSKTRDIRIVFF